MPKNGSQNGGGAHVRNGSQGGGNRYWASYKGSPASPVGVHPMANYQVIPAHHAMAFSGQGGGQDGMPLPQVIYPYGALPQAHMYGPPEGGHPHQGYYQHYMPMQMAVQMPVHRGPTPDGGAYEDDMDRTSLVLSRLSLNPVDEHYPGMMKSGRRSVMEEGSRRGRAQGGRKRRSHRSKDKQLALQENIKKTVYISDLDQQITEEQLAGFFSECGVVLDCRVCGDPNSALRFAFVEFTKFEEAVEAVKKTGCELGSSRVRVLPSKTAIVPVNKDLMPKNKDEMEQCSRTVYATNIDKKVDRDDVQRFFEALCGPVCKLRLLGDHAHSTRIAFVEFTTADSALAALSCSGALLGTMPIRVSPSKTPVRFTGKEIKE